MTNENPDVLIVGAGLSGLCCALRLHQEGFSVLILEASDGIGGRVRCDRVDGYILDRGFQVLLTAYPEAQRVLDYGSLDLRTFYPGALIRFDGRFHRIGDPWRHPLDAVTGVLSPIGKLRDKVRIGVLRRRVVSGSLEDIFGREETSTMEALRAGGFSEKMIDRFFRPFIGGVFFDRDLTVSSRMFEFGFRMFSSGDTALPSRGMGAIPEQIASRFPDQSIRTGARVLSVQEGGVTLASGERINGRAVVVATEAPETARLLGNEARPESTSTTCLYFAADEPPVTEPLLVLNGDGVGPINSLCVPSTIAPSYAPAGQALIAVTILGNPDLGDDQLEKAVRSQLSGWYGRPVERWRTLRTYRLLHALPIQTPPTPNPLSSPVQVLPWLFVSGEYDNVASIQWAMASGRRTAEAVAQALRV